MTTANMLRLILLAAIWGSSFLFMRICAPVLGPAVLIEYRVGVAALFLAVVGLVLNKRLDYIAIALVTGFAPRLGRRAIVAHSTTSR